MITSSRKINRVTYIRLPREIIAANPTYSNTKWNIEYDQRTNGLIFIPTKE